MADLIYVAIFLAFTALCVAYISWCDRIIGTEDLDNVGADAAEAAGAKATVTQ